MVDMNKFYIENPQFWSHVILTVALSTGTYEMIHTFTCKREKNSRNYADSIRCHRTKFNCLGGQATGICAPLIYDVS
jgi:hypothetical protein